MEGARHRTTAHPSGGRTAVRRVALARAISLTGSQAAFAALAYIVYRLTDDSAAWVSLTLLLTMGVQGLAQPVASWFGDRFDRRRVLVISDLLSAAGFVALAFARTPGQLVAIACVTAILESPVWAVAAAAMPNLVEDDDLAWANGQVTIGRNLGNFAGPLIGTAIAGAFAHGEDPPADRLHLAGAFVFGINAVSFVLSAWLIGRTPGRFNDPRPTASEHRGIRAGFRYAMRDRVLRAILIGWSVLILGAGLILVAEIPYADAFDQGPFGYGLLNALWGGGAAVGAVLAGRRLTARREPRALLAAFFFGGVLMFAIGWSPLWVLALAFVVGEGICEGVASVSEQGLLQRRTPDEVRSRVVGAVEAATLLALAISLTAGGPIVDALGPRAAYHIGGLTTLLATVIVLRPLRHPGLPPHQADLVFEHPTPELLARLNVPNASGEPGRRIGEQDAERGAPARAVLDPGPPTVRLGEAGDEREAHAEARRRG
jgi:MFS family permease